MAGSKGQSVPWDAQSSRQVGLGAQQTPPWHLQEGGHSTLLPLSVLDVNDESPTFFPAIYNVSLPENVARDFRVVRLNCTDADVGLNAELSYFITGMKGCMGELWLWKRVTCPRKSMRMGLMLLGRAFRAGILSGVLEHLMQVVFGGAGVGRQCPACSTAAAPAARGGGTPGHALSCKVHMQHSALRKQGKNTSVTRVIHDPSGLLPREKRCVLSHRYHRPHVKQHQLASAVFKK